MRRAEAFTMNIQDNIPHNIQDLRKLALTSTHALAKLRREVSAQQALVGLGILGFGAVLGAVGHHLFTRRWRRVEPNYQAWTKSKLYELAVDLDVPGRGEMSKDELIEAVSRAA